MSREQCRNRLAAQRQSDGRPSTAWGRLTNSNETLAGAGVPACQGFRRGLQCTDGSSARLRRRPAQSKRWIFALALTALYLFDVAEHFDLVRLRASLGTGAGETNLQGHGSRLLCVIDAAAGRRRRDSGPARDRRIPAAAEVFRLRSSRSRSRDRLPGLGLSWFKAAIDTSRTLRSKHNRSRGAPGFSSDAMPR
jgi:hypothetical protein